jgi:hypothetical protein
VAQVTVESVHEELERARVDFHGLVEHASNADLRKPSQGTRWTNEQLLFHMLLGYGVVRTLLPLVHLMARLPDPVSRTFAAALNAASRPFHVVNYLGPCAAARVAHGRRLTGQMDRTIGGLHRRLEAETAASLRRDMHFPTRWDPFFAETMTVLAVFHYGTQHYDFHRRQLTLDWLTPGRG